MSDFVWATEPGPLIALTGLLGLLVGSFLNVVILRLPKRLEHDWRSQARELLGHEEAGALDKMLFKVADFFEEEVNNAVDALASLLEPFIMVIIGVLVGGMVIGMYLPIFKLAAVVG